MFRYLILLLLTVFITRTPLPYAHAESEIDPGKEIRLKVSGEPGTKVFLNDQNTGRIVPVSGSLDLNAGKSECGKTYNFKITLQDAVGNFSEPQAVNLKAKDCPKPPPAQPKPYYFAPGLPQNISNNIRKASVDEAKEKIISFILNNYEDTTEIDNLNNDHKKLGDIKNSLSDNLNIHGWCNVWVQDLASIQEKNGDQGYDGIIVYNPMERSAFQVKNGIWEKYRIAGGPCSRLGVPTYTWGSYTENKAGVQKNSKAKNAYGQVFETPVYKLNAIYWYEWKEGRCWAIFGSCSTKNASYFVVESVAAHYWNHGGTWGEYGFPTGDTYSYECGGRQWFEYGEQIDFCKLNEGTSYSKRAEGHVLVINMNKPDQVCFKTQIGLHNTVGEKDQNGNLKKEFNATRFSELVTDHNANLNGNKPIAAFNTDFVSGSGAPLDTNVVQGNDYSGTRNWTSMDINRDNKVSFVNGSSANLYNTAGGGPRIFDGSGNFKQPGKSELGIWANARNNRTVAAITHDGRMIVIVSDHLELGHMKQVFDKIANEYFDSTYDGEMFDGGGSPGMYYDGQVKREGDNQISAAMLIFEGNACQFR